MNYEKDLGIILHSELKFHKQTDAAIKKANNKEIVFILNQTTVPQLHIVSAFNVDESR